ncbi:hypothetical protein BHM03_00031393 [Ensete ventricosum]|nr:hypothetical protein BHM03_00031393 [Ensete ventricosum]
MGERALGSTTRGLGWGIPILVWGERWLSLVTKGGVGCMHHLPRSFTEVFNVCEHLRQLVRMRGTDIAWSVWHCSLSLVIGCVVASSYTSSTHEKDERVREGGRGSHFALLRQEEEAQGNIT